MLFQIGLRMNNSSSLRNLLNKSCIWIAGVQIDPSITAFSNDSEECIYYCIHCKILISVIHVIFWYLNCHYPLLFSTMHAVIMEYNCKIICYEYVWWFMKDPLIIYGRNGTCVRSKRQLMFMKYCLWIIVMKIWFQDKLTHNSSWISSKSIRPQQ